MNVDYAPLPHHDLAPATGFVIPAHLPSPVSLSAAVSASSSPT